MVTEETIGKQADTTHSRPGALPQSTWIPIDKLAPIPPAILLPISVEKEDRLLVYRPSLLKTLEKLVNETTYGSNRH